MMYLASLAEEMKDKVDGYKFIHTKSELDKIVVDNLNSNKVIIRQDFAHEFFTPTGLIKYIQNVRRINFNLIIELDMDSKIITTKDIESKVSSCRTIEELIDLAVTYDVEFMDTLNGLIEFKKRDNNVMLEYSNQVSRLQSIVEGLQAELSEKEYALKLELQNKLAFQSKFHALVSRINYQYGKDIDKTKLFNVDKNSYDKILYIKEITRVQHVDTLVYYLQEILKTLYSMPTRVLCIEGYYAEGKIDQYPQLKPHHNLIERDVLKGDILMLGMQPKLMQDILKNASNISILIVLDRGGYDVPHISGDNVEVIYTVSDLKDKPEWIPAGRCISYSNESLFIKYIKDFDKMDITSKIGAYSSMSIMKKLVQLIERK